MVLSLDHISEGAKMYLFLYSLFFSINDLKSNGLKSNDA